MIGATITRPIHPSSMAWSAKKPNAVRDEQVRVECIAGVVTFRLEDGTTLEFDEVQLGGELFFASHGDAA